MLFGFISSWPCSSDTTALWWCIIPKLLLHRRTHHAHMKKIDNFILIIFITVLFCSLNLYCHILFTAWISIANIAHNAQMVANLKTKKKRFKCSWTLYGRNSNAQFLFSGDKALHSDFVERKNETCGEQYIEFLAIFLFAKLHERFTLISYFLFYTL